jgi:hypothetical protein
MSQDARQRSKTYQTLENSERACNEHNQDNFSLPELFFTREEWYGHHLSG